MNQTGQIGGDNPTLGEDGDSASLALRKSGPNSSANQPQEEECTHQMPVDAASQRAFSASQKDPDKNSTNTDPQNKSVGTSTLQKKGLAECTEDEILRFLAVLRSTNGKTIDESTPPSAPALHYNNQYI